MAMVHAAKMNSEASNGKIEELILKAQTLAAQFEKFAKGNNVNNGDSNDDSK